MKKAIVIFKDLSSTEVKYDDAEKVFMMLEKGRFVTFGKRTLPVEDIRWIEWID